jgi:hypothetical protein
MAVQGRPFVLSGGFVPLYRDAGRLKEVLLPGYQFEPSWPCLTYIGSSLWPIINSYADGTGDSPTPSKSLG